MPGILNILLLIGLMLAGAIGARAQGLRLREIERSYDAVVLIADAQTGRMLGGARVNEATDRRFYPGSLFKLAIAVAALRSGRFDRSYTYTCNGKDTIGGAVRHCWKHRGHATIGFKSAISESCNLYFRRLAGRLTADEIAQSARALGLLPSLTGSDLAAVPDISDDNLLGDAFAVSPAQMLDVAVALASRGRLSRGAGDLFGALYRPLYDGLRECVRTGTGKEAWSRKFSLAGKTGTSEIPGTRLTVGWFIGFAPVESPRYAIVVMQRRARGAEAAVVARKALEKLM
jgi:cell division protein FtsI/penicillin-binding protein 2